MQLLFWFMLAFGSRSWIGSFPRFANAFPHQAGSCPLGKTAVAGLHRQLSPQGGGHLSNGGLEILLNGMPVSTPETEQNFATDVEATVQGLDFDLTVTGEFRGILIRVNGTTEDQVTSEDWTAPARVCSVGSATHFRNLLQTSGTINVSLDQMPSDHFLWIDITVVVRNSAILGQSLWYYSSLGVSIEEQNPFPNTRPNSASSDSPSTLLLSPTGEPSRFPILHSDGPSAQPSTRPTIAPSKEQVPTTRADTAFSSSPSIATVSNFPTAEPSILKPVTASETPSVHPTISSSGVPTNSPHLTNTESPSVAATSTNSVLPITSASPIGDPSMPPMDTTSGEPSLQVSVQPNISSSGIPTVFPHSNTTDNPSASISSASPTVEPSILPTTRISEAPSLLLSMQPTSSPSQAFPHSNNTESPSDSTTPASLTGKPSISPMATKTEAPSQQVPWQPTFSPSGIPVVLPSFTGTESPPVSSASPREVPETNAPSARYSVQRTNLPSVTWTAIPNSVRSRSPSFVEGYPSSSTSMGTPATILDTNSTSPTVAPTTAYGVISREARTKSPGDAPSLASTAVPSGAPSSAGRDTPQNDSSSSSRSSIQPTGVSSFEPSSIQPTGVSSFEPSRAFSTSSSDVPSNTWRGMPHAIILSSIRPSYGSVEPSSVAPNYAPTNVASDTPNVSTNSFKPSSVVSIVPNDAPSTATSSSRLPTADWSKRSSGKPSSDVIIAPSHNDPNTIRNDAHAPTNMGSRSPNTIRPSSLVGTVPSDSPTISFSATPSSSARSLVPNITPNTLPSSDFIPSDFPSTTPSTTTRSIAPSPVPIGTSHNGPSVDTSSIPSTTFDDIHRMKPTIIPTSTGFPSLSPGAQSSTRDSSAPLTFPSREPTVDNEPYTSRPSSTLLPSQQPTKEIPASSSVPPSMGSIAPSHQLRLESQSPETIAPTSSQVVDFPTSAPTSPSLSFPTIQPTFQPMTTMQSLPPSTTAPTTMTPTVLTPSPTRRLPTVEFPTIGPSLPVHVFPTMQLTTSPTEEPQYEPPSQVPTLSLIHSTTPDPNSDLVTSGHPALKPSSLPSNEPSRKVVVDTPSGASPTPYPTFVYCTNGAGVVIPCYD